jgi:hypothetical protein
MSDVLATAIVIQDAIEDWALNMLDYFGIRTIQPAQGEVAAGQVKAEIDALSTKVGVIQNNKLDRVEYDTVLRSLEAKIAKIKAAEEQRGAGTPLFTALTAKVQAAKDEAAKPADPPNPQRPRPAPPPGAGATNYKLRNAVGMLLDLQTPVDRALKGLRVAVPDDTPAPTDAQQNDRLASLNITPKQGPNEKKTDYIKRLNAFNERIANENGTATPADRLARLKEADALLTHADLVVQDHTAKLLYRAVSVGMGDCEPLLIKYATELAKKTPQGAPAGNLGQLQAMAKILCDRMVAKDLFGRYVGEMLTGSGAVEKLQNGDANDFYFWSQTSYMVDQSIDAANLDSKKLAVRLEKSAAAAMFDDLNFNNAWSSDHFRAIFEAISGAYADKAVARAKDAAKAGSNEPAVILTAYRGVNLGSVLGKTEWPRIKKAITDNNLKFKFDVYCWNGAPVSSGFPATKWGFADAKFTSAKFNGMAIHQSLTDVGAVDATTWTFEDYDDLTKRGGLHKAGKGAGSSFATMPVAFFDKTTLVGKDTSTGHIWFMNADGSPLRDSGKSEAAFVQNPT